MTHSSTHSDEKHLVDKLLDLKESFKKKKCFNDEDLQQLKNCLKDIPRFRDIPPNIRVDTLPFFEMIELKQNEIIVKKDNPNVSLYLLVQGRLKKSVHAPWNSYKVRKGLTVLGRRGQKGTGSHHDKTKLLGN